MVLGMRVQGRVHVLHPDLRLSHTRLQCSHFALTGVGKTELAKALAAYLFNTEDAMVG